MVFNPLGHHTEYVSVYTPELLFPIKRAESRGLLGITADLPFYGVDVWTGYELSWLDAQGKPVVAVAEFFIPCTSEFMVESKSFKLYLNSFNQTRFNSVEDVESILVKDLSRVANAAVVVSLRPLSSLTAKDSLLAIAQLQGQCIDELPVAIEHYHPRSALLSVEEGVVVDESLYSHLLKTNCPVTGQPDWASIQIDYKGNKIEQESLLRYIVSFREHQDFHEHCVERIFTDILRECKPQALTVYARYTRRGGLDINPFRTTSAHYTPVGLRLIRQ